MKKTYPPPCVWCGSTANPKQKKSPGFCVGCPPDKCDCQSCKDTIDVWNDAIDAAIKAAQLAVPRAHTYASENADIYIAHDNARDRIISALELLRIKK